MKRFFIFFSLALGSALSLPAQEESEASESSVPNAEQVQRAIDEFNRNKKSKVSDVTVVLDPPAKAKDSKKSDKTEEGPEKTEAAPVHEPDAETPLSEEDPTFLSETPTDPEGMTVRVESLRNGNDPATPGDEMTVKNSFPVKALAQTPNGWKLETSEAAPAYTREVEVKPGTFVTVKITPHVLSPDADGSKIFSVTEPGYDPQKGYEQGQTVGTILEKTISQLDTVSVKMDVTLSELHRLLASLPKPETPNPKKP